MQIALPNITPNLKEDVVNTTELFTAPFEEMENVLVEKQVSHPILADDHSLLPLQIKQQHSSVESDNFQISNLKKPPLKNTYKNDQEIKPHLKKNNLPEWVEMPIALMYPVSLVNQPSLVSEENFERHSLQKSLKENSLNTLESKPALEFNAPLKTVEKISSFSDTFKTPTHNAGLMNSIDVIELDDLESESVDPQSADRQKTEAVLAKSHFKDVLDLLPDNLQTKKNILLTEHKKKDISSDGDLLKTVSVKDTNSRVLHANDVWLLELPEELLMSHDLTQKDSFMEMPLIKNNKLEDDHQKHLNKEYFMQSEGRMPFGYSHQNSEEYLTLKQNVQTASKVGLPFDFMYHAPKQSLAKSISDMPENKKTAEEALFMSPVASLYLDSFITRAEHPSVSSSEQIFAMQHFIAHLKENVQLGKNFFKMKISPEHLGSLDVQIFYEKDKIRLKIITQNEAAKSILEGLMGDLKKNLEHSGFYLQTCEVSNDNSMQYSHVQAETKNSFEQSSRNLYDPAKSEELPLRKASKSFPVASYMLHRGNLNIVA